MAADRGAFIDQSQSFNVFIGEPNFGKLTSMHFYGWKKVRASLFNVVFFSTKRDGNQNALKLRNKVAPHQPAS